MTTLGLGPEWILTYCPWAVEDASRHTRLTVISYQYSNIFGVGGDLDFLYRLFLRDSTGEILVEEEIGRLRPNQIWQAEVGDLIRRAGRNRLAAGNLTLAARPADSAEPNLLRIPQFEVDYYNDQGDWEAVHSKGFSPQYWYPPEFAFARVLETPDYQSYLAIQNLSPADPAQPRFVLMKPNGERRRVNSTILDPGGSAFLAVRDLFTGIGAFLQNQPAALLIEVNQSRVLPYLFIENRHTGALSADHYTMPV